MSTADANKIRNEEFKIWKKAVPALYQHISTFRPPSTTVFERVEQVAKVVAFTREVVPDAARGTLAASLLCSQGSDVYEVEFELPLGLHDDDDDDSGGRGGRGDPQYGPAFARPAQREPKWTYQGETITKLQCLGTSSAVAMTASGSLAWFQAGCRAPVSVVEELVGPATSFSQIHDQSRAHGDARADFAVSGDLATLVKSQPGPGSASLLKVVDNSAQPAGRVVRVILVPGTSATPVVRFLDNHLFAACSDDSTVRFFDVRGDGSPLWALTDPHDGRVTSMDVSPFVETLFLTGSDTGVLKLWDLRSIVACAPTREEPRPIAKFYQSAGDAVADIKFGVSSPTEVLTVGRSGNVYHWDLEPVFVRDGDNDHDHDHDHDDDAPDPEELQQLCLKFMHTGGGRRNVANCNQRDTVTWHPVICGLVGCVDPDGVLTVYKGLVGTDEESSAPSADEDEH
ncbi:LADA_0C07426g1_1 [Lachancea dasiensis]|uniref:LADA_0C07426g1_1 n=1 Tax=Lachancea dasiensis TaxID=1072105 RepID=A0A1G4IZS2_9SACH|nr:LADA_0C07426g1_1 [Lachancea dasiensis]